MRDAEARALAESGLGSGLLARQAPPAEADSVAVLKVCPHCGTEYETSARFCPSDGTALRPKGADSLIGRVLADRYHILKRIGEGGMGRVYLGEHVKMNRQCAIKVMSPALLNDSESAARFAREASNAARIIHPNVAAVFDYGDSDGLIYLVMEFVDGEPLARLLAREAPLALDRALDLGSQIADGLGAAHELGIIHRDLKPDNILVTRTRGREIAKVVDFGIAKAVQEGVGESLTRTGQVIGTPEFMSPEQLLGDPVDARSDLYALGCILHLMLTGSPPFDAPTREMMIKRRLSEEAPHIHDVDEGIPDTVARIVERLLARTPGDRYGSAAEVQDALAGTHVRRADAVRAQRKSKPTPRSAPTVAFLHATQATTEVTDIPVVRPTRRVPLIVGTLAVGAVAAAFALRGRASPAEAERVANVARDSASRAALAVARTESLPVVVAPAPVTATPEPLPVDTAAVNALARQKRQRDSVARVAKLDTAAVRAPLVRYARAMESGNVTMLHAAYPAMTAKQQEYWEQTVFSRAERITATVRYGAMRIKGDSAEAEFRLSLSVVQKATSQVNAYTFRQRAILVKQGGTWTIVNVGAA